jgi:hypothetical protein
MCQIFIRVIPKFKIYLHLNTIVMLRIEKIFTIIIIFFPPLGCPMIIAVTTWAVLRHDVVSKYQ